MGTCQVSSPRAQLWLAQALVVHTELLGEQPKPELSRVDEQLLEEP